MERHNVSRLIEYPGYIGYEAGGHSMKRLDVVHIQLYYLMK